MNLRFMSQLEAFRRDSCVELTTQQDFPSCWAFSCDRGQLHSHNFFRSMHGDGVDCSLPSIRNITGFLGTLPWHLEWINWRVRSCVAYICTRSDGCQLFNDTHQMDHHTSQSSISSTFGLDLAICLSSPALSTSE